ncbi:MAG TPA: hypothetical protein VGU71_22400 [Candidatus Dormibacteraeota bacterium]|nr:hypothetical protein [Candidatus Dormibacteraeota bacterium]
MIDLDRLEHEVEHLPDVLAGDFIGWYELGEVRRQRVVGLIREARSLRALMLGEKGDPATLPGMLEIGQRLIELEAQTDRFRDIVGAAEIWRHWWLKTHGRSFLAGDKQMQSFCELRDAAEITLEHEVAQLTAKPEEVAST